MKWTVLMVEEVAVWIEGLPEEARLALVDAIDRLRAEGPTLPRPLADKIKNSRHHNMKELRPPSPGRMKVRVLFAFDPKRQAILLVGGDKSGQWEKWYKDAIPVADDRFDEWLANECEP